MLGVLFMIALQLLYTYAPFMNIAFQSSPIGWMEWLLCVGVGLVIYLVIEVEKKFTHERNRSQTVTRPGLSFSDFNRHR